MRVVVDANVYVSALISSSGASARIIERWLQAEFDVLISPTIVKEVQRVTAYEKLQKYARLRENRQEFVQLLSEQANLVEPEETLAVVGEDEADYPSDNREDNRYVECAVAGDAQYVVSGDPHLLNLGEYQGIRFVSSTTFVSLLESGIL